jgi:hypothetical protein
MLENLTIFVLNKLSTYPVWQMELKLISAASFVMPTLLG